MFFAKEKGVSLASNVSTKSARCIFQHLWAVVNWGLTLLPPESFFSWEPSPYSGQHCTLGGLPRRLWVFSEHRAGLSVLITDRKPEPYSAHSGTLDGTDNRFFFLRRNKINLCWFYIIPFLCLIFFSCKCQLPFLEKIKQEMFMVTHPCNPSIYELSFLCCKFKASLDK